MFNPLQSDEDAPHEDVMTARAVATFAWGSLRGLLAHAPTQVCHHFCCALIRLALEEALVQAGFGGGHSWFSDWFSGLEATKGATLHNPAPASDIAGMVLAELSLSAWEPLAEAAQQIRASAHFDREMNNKPQCAQRESILEEAATLLDIAKRGKNDEWPLAVLDRVHAAAAASADFSPVEREPYLLSLPTGPMAIEKSAVPAPLWTIDLLIGLLLTQSDLGLPPLPCPGAIRAEALKSHFLPRERSILVANTATEAANRLIKLLNASYRCVGTMELPTASLRSTSRGPALYRLLAGFGPMRPIQIERAMSVSKNGARELVSALARIGLVETTKRKGQVVVCALLPTRSGSRPAPLEVARERADSVRFAEFDAAMADIDRLLLRTTA